MANTYDSSNMERINLTKGNKEYYYNTENGKYYIWTVPTSGTGGFTGGSVLGYQEVTNEAEIKDLKSEFPYGSDAVQGDYNPYLNTESTISTKLAVGRAVAPENARSVRYPHDMRIGDSEDFVLFDFYDYKPPFQDKKIPGPGQALNQTIEQYNATGFSSEYFKDKEYPQILLYMPDDISDTFKADWEGKAFGAITAGVLASAGQKDTVNKVKELTNTATGALERAGVNAAASLVAGLAKKLTGDNISADDIFGGISGVARNPNVELLFQKANLRTFDLTFKMSPYDERDGQSIRAIIQIFKQAMLPQYALGNAKVFGYEGDQNGAIQAGFIKVPKICHVAYMRGNVVHPHLPRYKMCAITDVSVNYTPDGNYASISRGPMAAVELKLSFMETKLVFSEDVTDRGF